MANRKLVVVSDLHVGSGDLDDFDDELENAFAKFLKQQCSQSPVELILNGDILDFIQADPVIDKPLDFKHPGTNTPLCYCEEQSVEKFKNIIDCHEQFFRALRGILSASSSNRITILPGNHDIDFWWPAIEIELQICLQVSDRIDQPVRIIRSRYYCPSGFPGLRIEHGHMFDPINRIDLNGSAGDLHPILIDQHGTPRLIECAGTRLMHSAINRLDRDYPFVDNLNPIGHMITTILSSALHREYGPIRLILALYGAFSQLTRTLLKEPDDILSTESLGGIPPVNEYLNELPEDKQNQVRRALLSHPDCSDLYFPAILAGHDLENVETALLDLVEDLPIEPISSSPPPQRASRLAFLSARRGERELLTQGAIRLLSGGYRQIVFGHTHQIEDGTSPTGYFNTGSWTRTWNGEDASVWDGLQMPATNYPASCHFLVITDPKIPAKLEFFTRL